MNCRDVREAGDSFLGNRSLTETDHEILGHLETCPSCRMELEGRRRLRGALRAAFERAPDLRPRATFGDQVRDRLRAASVQRHPSSMSPPRWFALAAGLVVVTALAAGLLKRSGSPADALARDAIGDH